MAFVHWSEVPSAPAGAAGVWFIYALLDPRDNCVRYVGVTDKALERRLEGHMRKPTNALMRGWIAELVAAGLRPCTRLLSAPTGAWEQAEQGWIGWFRARGELLNIDPGGRARNPDGTLKPWAAKLNLRQLRGEQPIRRKKKRRRPARHKEQAAATRSQRDKLSARLAEISRRQMTRHRETAPNPKAAAPSLPDRGRSR